MILPPYTTHHSSMARTGRPTSYRPEFCDTIIELGREGASFVEMALACGVTRNTAHEWKKRYPEFQDAYLRARDESLAWWHRKAKEGQDKGSRGFNERAWWRMVSNMFPDDFKDRREVDVRSVVGHVDLNRMPDSVVERIAAGEDITAVLASAAKDGVRLLGAPGTSVDSGEAPPGEDLEAKDVTAARDANGADSEEPAPVGAEHGER